MLRFFGYCIFLALLSNLFSFETAVLIGIAMMITKE